MFENFTAACWHAPVSPLPNLFPMIYTVPGANTQSDIALALAGAPKGRRVLLFNGIPTLWGQPGDVGCWPTNGIAATSKWWQSVLAENQIDFLCLDDETSFDVQVVSDPRWSTACHDCGFITQKTDDGVGGVLQMVSSAYAAYARSQAFGQSVPLTNFGEALAAPWTLNPYPIDGDGHGCVCIAMSGFWSSPAFYMQSRQLSQYQRTPNNMGPMDWSNPFTALAWAKWNAAAYAVANKSVTPWIGYQSMNGVVGGFVGLLAQNPAMWQEMVRHVMLTLKTGRVLYFNPKDVPGQSTDNDDLLMSQTMQDVQSVGQGTVIYTDPQFSFPPNWNAPAIVSGPLLSGPNLIYRVSVNPAAGPQILTLNGTLVNVTGNSWVKVPA